MKAVEVSYMQYYIKSVKYVYREEREEFLPCDHGLDFDITAYYVRIQSIKNHVVSI